MSVAVFWALPYLSLELTYGCSKRIEGEIEEKQETGEKKRAEV